MNPSQKRSSTDATPALTASKKPKILTTPSGIALPQTQWFDPWNSSATGHQRAENNLAGSTSWRDSRNLKLTAQYQGGRGGGKWVADAVGAGSEDFGKDGRKVNGSWKDAAKGLRDKSQPSLMDCLTQGKRLGHALTQSHSIAGEGETLSPEAAELERAIAASMQNDFQAPGGEQLEDHDLDRAIAASVREQVASSAASQASQEADSIPPSNQADYHDSLQPQPSETDDLCAIADQPKQIFRNLVFYINGSTAPLISDHKLKYLISSHGGSLTISHARKQVTHVIIGMPQNHLAGRPGFSGVGGAGGSLSGTKIQKEVMKHRGRGTKFVAAQWIIDSVKHGKRMAEANYENVKLGGAGQGSVLDKFKIAKPESSETSRKV